MSDFLVNLARRGAGLAPVVAAPAHPLPEPPSEMVDAPASDVPTASRRSSAAAAEQPRLVVSAPAPEVRIERVGVPISSAPTVVVQRAPLDVPAAAPLMPLAPPRPLAADPAARTGPAPAPRAIEPSAPVTTSAPTIAPATEPTVVVVPQVVREHEVRIVAAPATVEPVPSRPPSSVGVTTELAPPAATFATQIAQSPAPDRPGPPAMPTDTVAVAPATVGIVRRQEGAQPRAVHAPTASDPPAPVAPTLTSSARRIEEDAPRPSSAAPTVEVVREQRRVVEHVVESPVGVRPAPRAETIAPLPMVARPTSPLNTSESPRERVVHVRIGTIDVRGASAPDAPATPIATTPAPDARSASGFDDFVRLRTYAPWQW